ncbi:MAG TPA: vitamin K epoxide reductase family protein, partial [Solirubrobacteraceae bacterium]|nr:vitamin K epoxide reductase family protein [Solirubrobacteraceae bacterium]
VGFAFSGYLTYRELFSIHAICEWCASSAVILTLLFICAAYRYVTVSDLSASASSAPLAPKGTQTAAAAARPTRRSKART